MSEEQRPDPDQLLESIQLESSRAGRGRLKIFLGMAPGVGKTFEMLTQAQRLCSKNFKVVIGVVETHGRSETAALVKNFEVIPKRKAEYRGTDLAEMDLDAILAAKPNLALVDEFAHTNIPGSRNQKRYQDVLELIQSGIDVFTTVNVQHIESRVDAVHRITGVQMRETIPDSILDSADDIEMVDLLPDMLLQRLSEGKVYLGDRAEAAAQNFFQKGNLTALRELALRLTTERVDSELAHYERENEFLFPLKTSSRLLVAIGPSPNADKLIRWTRQAAYNLQAPWYAVYVEGGKPLEGEDRKFLAKNMEMAEGLGAKLITTSDSDIARGLIRVAKQNRISQIVVGKPAESRLRSLMGDSSFAHQLLRESGNIDIVLVQGDQAKTRTYRSILARNLSSKPYHYLYSLIHLGLALIFSSLCLPYIGYSAVGLILLLTVLVQGLFLESGPVILSAILAGTLWDYLFIPPRFTFYVSKVEDLLLLCIFVIGAIFVGYTASKVRSREKIFSRKEKEANTLYEFSRELAESRSLDEIVKKIIRAIGSIFSTDVALFIRDENSQFPASAHPKSAWIPPAKEISIAHYAFDHQQRVGQFTMTLRDSEALHLPLRAGGETIGVLSIKPRPRKLFSSDQLSFLETFCHSAAIAIQKEILSHAESRAQTAEESERLHKTLLSSISHELRTPITAISGSASGLKDPRLSEDPKTRNFLIEEIETASDRLNELVENLLDMSRLESGHLKPKREWIEVEDILNVVLKSFNPIKIKERFTSQIPANLPLIQADFVLTEQILHNLIRNALTHTPVDTPIEIRANVEDKFISIYVSDRGPGIPAEDLPKIFEKFHRSSQATTGGTGLGLSICKGFAEAQGAKISAGNNNGAWFCLQFPLLKQPEIPKES